MEMLDELAEIIAGAKAFQTPDGNPDLKVFQDQRVQKAALLKRRSLPEKPAADYKFTSDLNWDVFDILDPDVSQYITNSSFQLYQLGLHREPPAEVIKYVLAAPVPEGPALARTALGLPSVDRFILMALLLTNNDEYVPLHAIYTGKPIEEEEHQWIRQAIRDVAKGVSVDTPPPAKPAPKLPGEIEEWIQEFKEAPLDKYQQEDMARDLAALPPLQMSEAISRLVPFGSDTDRRWLFNASNNGAIIARAHAEAMRSNPKIYKNKDLREAPWKTGWILPSNYEPEMKIDGSFNKIKIFPKRH